MDNKVDLPTGPDAPSSPKKGDSRFLGIVFLVVGLLLLAVFLGWPIYQANRAADEVYISKKGIAAGLILVLLGGAGSLFPKLLTIVFGDPEKDLMNTKLGDLPAAFWLYGAAGTALLVYVFDRLKGYFEAHGYQMTW